MSLRQRDAAATPTPPHRNGRLHAVLSATGNQWNALSGDVMAIIVFKRVEDALKKADVLLYLQFFNQDGPMVLRELCAALGDLMSLKLTNKMSREFATVRFQEVLSRLESLTFRINGWRRRNPDDNVARMCSDLEALLDESREASRPPVMSRQRNI